MNGRLLKQYNHAAIALVPKIKHAHSPNDFRPISCCNVIYTTISKLIANRTTPVTLKLIDPAQATFIEKRLMNDNILFAQQLVRRYGRKTSTSRCMMMVDLRKAFDTLSWTFLNSILRSLGFPSLMTDWVMECISIVFFSIS